jgi:hypothetical protein
MTTAFFLLQLLSYLLPYLPLLPHASVFSRFPLGPIFIAAGVAHFTEEQGFKDMYPHQGVHVCMCVHVCVCVCVCVCTKLPFSLLSAGGWKRGMPFGLTGHTASLATHCLSGHTASLATLPHWSHCLTGHTASPVLLQLCCLCQVPGASGTFQGVIHSTSAGQVRHSAQAFAWDGEVGRWGRFACTAAW